MTKAHQIFFLKLLRDAVIVTFGLACGVGLIFAIRAVMFWMHSRFHWGWPELIGCFFAILAAFFIVGVIASCEWDSICGLFYSRWRDAERQAEFEACKEDAEHSLLRASKAERE